MTQYMVMLSCAAIILSSCANPEPVPINYGTDQCARCRMAISDSKFGAEAVTTKAKIYKFDSPECMLGWYAAAEIPQDQVHSLWVSDFIRPGDLLDAHAAFFLESEMFRSPMGMNFAAFKTDEERRRASYSYPGSERTFDNTLTAAKDW